MFHSLSRSRLPLSVKVHLEVKDQIRDLFSPRSKLDLLFNRRVSTLARFDLLSSRMFELKSK